MSADSAAPIAVQLEALAANATAASAHYRDHPEQVTRGVIVDLYAMIARLARLAARCDLPSERDPPT